MKPLHGIYANGSEHYEISDEDIAGDIQYFGYLSQSGKWIIQQRDATTDLVTDRYINGGSSYSTAWTNRAILTPYVYYNEMKNVVP